MTSPGGWFNIKMPSYQYRPIMEIRWSYDRLISTMGFPILERWHLYIESGPRDPFHKWFESSQSKSRKKCLAFAWKIMIRSGHNFAYVMTAQLLCHVQNCDLFESLETKLEQKEFHKISVMSSRPVCEMSIVSSPQGVSEWLNLMTFLGTADSEVHIVHRRRIITACTLESLSSLT